MPKMRVLCFCRFSYDRITFERSSENIPLYLLKFHYNLEPALTRRALVMRELKRGTARQGCSSRALNKVLWSQDHGTQNPTGKCGKTRKSVVFRFIFIFKEVMET